MSLKHIILSLFLTLPLVGIGQTTDTTKRSWHYGIRAQFLAGVRIGKSSYIDYSRSTPNSSSNNKLAGFIRRGVNPSAIVQLDYDVLRKSKRLSLYTGLSWKFHSIEYHGVQDSLISIYQLDTIGYNPSYTSNLHKRVIDNYLDLVVSINAEKFFGFHSEIGLSFTIFESFRFSERRNGSWKLLSSGAIRGYTASSIYTSLGYPIKLKRVLITPIARLDYYPFYGTQFALSGGISFTVT